MTVFVVYDTSESVYHSLADLDLDAARRVARWASYATDVRVVQTETDATSRVVLRETWRNGEKV